MYKTKSFQKRSLEQLFGEIDTLALHNSDANKVFLADGDALVLETSYLIKILKYLQKSFPKLSRVSLYATTQNIQNKSSEELNLLKEHKLSLFYVGIESGNESVLKKINKGVTALEIIDALNKISAANIKISATVILGVGGSIYSISHAKDTANIVNKTTINYLSTLQIHLDDIVEEQFNSNFPDFTFSNEYQILNEQRSFIENLAPLNKVIFRSNHVSNTLALKGIIPRDNKKLIQVINSVID